MSLAGKGYRVVAIDQRGHGLSDKPDGGYDMPTVVNDLSSLIVAMQLDRPVVAGQSWGGNVVVELANRHPELVSGVCAVDGGLIQLVDRFPDWETCAKLLAPPQLTGTRASDFERMIRNAYSDWPETAILGTLANMEVLSDGTIRPWLSRERHMQVLRGLWDHRPREVVNSLRRPVLFTPADGNDRPAGASDARGIRKREEYDAVVSGLEHVRVEWFSPAHHDLHAQFPQRWAQTLHTYIENGFLT
jgi:pimeloyl-ACP methyl ester carboxylesterase